jgi:hypothetical protein
MCVKECSNKLSKKYRLLYFSSVGKSNSSYYAKVLKQFLTGNEIPRIILTYHDIDTNSC